MVWTQQMKDLLGYYQWLKKGGCGTQANLDGWVVVGRPKEACEIIWSRKQGVVINGK